MRNSPLPLLPYVLFGIGCLVGAMAPLGGQPAALPDASTSGLSSDAFRNPPVSARPRAYWNWLNGSVDHDQLTRDLEEMKAKGMGGADMWDTATLRNPDGMVPSGPPFLGPESVAAIHHALKQAERLGLELGLVASSGWNAGGSWVTPEQAGKNIYCATLAVEGPGRVQAKLPFPEVPANCPKDATGLPIYHREIALFAIPAHPEKRIESLEGILNLGRFLDNGILDWEAPPGKWIVARLVLTNNGQQLIAGSPNSQGLFIDFLDPAATRMHFGYMLDRIGLKDGINPFPAFRSMELDSMELEHGIQWSEPFAAYFKQSRGYDPIPWLPALLGWTLGDRETTERFLYDYHQAISDLLITSHYTTGQEVLNEYGLELVAEAGGPGPPIWNTCPVDALKALGNVDVPRGEFWIRHRNMFLIKEIASASHIYGKPIVDAESFTTWRRWKDSPFAVKPAVDRAFCEGLNRITYHGFAHSPPQAGFPGWTYHAGYDLNPRVTWWEMARPFIDYLSRCCYLLQQGDFVADVCYYYGDQAPNFFPLFHDVPEKPTLPGLGSGYDYDVINTDILLNSATFDNGHIVLSSGMKYRLLLLPQMDTLPLPVLEKLRDLIRSGATVIGPAPLGVPELLDHEKKDEQFRRIVSEVWGELANGASGERTFGKGRVLTGRTPDEVLSALGVPPDFSAEGSRGEVDFDFIHRRAGDSEIYFVQNKRLDWASAVCRFRVADKVPEFWNPDTGETAPALEFTAKGNLTEVSINLPPAGSVFVVFASKEEPLHLASASSRVIPMLDSPSEKATLHNITPTTVSLKVRHNGEYALVDRAGQEHSVQVTEVPSGFTLTGPWQVAFPEGWGAPPVKEFDRLLSWTDCEEEGIKYFSGTATYRRSIQIPQELLSPDTRLYLNLGEVRDLASVTLNNQPLGILWKEPYEVEITKAAKAGDNHLEIRIANQWVNRLTLDMDLPPEKRLTNTNQPAWKKEIGGDEFWRLQPAGLLGPVKVVPAKTFEIPANGWVLRRE